MYCYLLLGIVVVVIDWLFVVVQCIGQYQVGWFSLCSFWMWVLLKFFFSFSEWYFGCFLSVVISCVVCDIISIWECCVVWLIRCLRVGSRLGCRLVFGLLSISSVGGCGDNRVVIYSRQCRVLFDSFVVCSGCSRLGCLISILKCFFGLLMCRWLLGKVLFIVLFSVVVLLILWMVCRVVVRLVLLVFSIGVWVLICGCCVGVLVLLWKWLQKCQEWICLCRLSSFGICCGFIVVFSMLLKVVRCCVVIFQ